jgi:NAD(P)-dependent dehydrogenase (short-subunit alcohol dehydrogenase family)
MGNVDSSQRNNGFDWYSTADQVIANTDLSGKNVIVTGANSGIGKETSRVLAKNGANVIMACRSLERGQEAIEEIKKQHPDAKVHLLPLDLGSLKSVKEFAHEFDALKLPLHILICNAGIMATPFSQTPEGHELQFGTNHLGHFLLTKLLLPRLKEGQPSRVVVVSSTAHRFSGINFDDINGKGTWYTGSTYSKFKAYGQSKAANILFAIELDRRMRAQGLQITANALHPGAIKTNLQLHVQDSNVVKYSEKLKLDTYFFKTIPQGAATSVYVACSPSIEGIGGRYFSDSNLAVPATHACDPNVARRLWDVSEEMTKEFTQ